MTSLSSIRNTVRRFNGVPKLTFFKYDRCFNTFKTLKQKNSTLKRGMLFTHARTTKKIDEEKKLTNMNTVPRLPLRQRSLSDLPLNLWMDMSIHPPQGVPCFVGEWRLTNVSLLGVDVGGEERGRSTSMCVFCAIFHSCRVLYSWYVLVVFCAIFDKAVEVSICGTGWSCVRKKILLCTNHMSCYVHTSVKT